MIDKFILAGWRIADVALLAVALCVLFSVILGAGSGGFIADVAANAVGLLQKLPSGTVIGLALLVFLWQRAKAKCG